MRRNRAVSWTTLAAIGAVGFAGSICAGVLAPERPLAGDSDAQTQAISTQANSSQSTATPSTSTPLAAPSSSAASPAAKEPAWRGMRKDLFVSSRDPQMEMRVAPDLKYIGKAEFDLKDVAHVERHHFVAVENGEVKRMLVLQFEEMLPTNNDIYKWKVKKPQTIGNQVYDFNTFVFSVAKATQTHPEAEVARTQELLAAKNLRLQDELAVVRFARVIGQDRRREFIIFYNEPLAAMSRPQDVATGEQNGPAFQNLSSALTEHALASFSIAELPPENP